MFKELSNFSEISSTMILFCDAYIKSIQRVKSMAMWPISNLYRSFTFSTEILSSSKKLGMNCAITNLHVHENVSKIKPIKHTLKPYIWESTVILLYDVTTPRVDSKFRPSHAYPFHPLLPFLTRGHCCRCLDLSSIRLGTETRADTPGGSDTGSGNAGTWYSPEKQDPLGNFPTLEREDTLWKEAT